jgi:hypothetical protein
MAETVKYLECWAPTGRMRMKEGKEVEEPWTRIGAAFPLKDGSGFSIKLSALPLNGTIIIKPPRPKQDDTAAPEGI